MTITLPNAIINVISVTFQSLKTHYTSLYLINVPEGSKI